MHRRPRRCTAACCARRTRAAVLVLLPAAITSDRGRPPKQNLSTTTTALPASPLQSTVHHRACQPGCGHPHVLVRPVAHRRPPTDRMPWSLATADGRPRCTPPSVLSALSLARVLPLSPGVRHASDWAMAVPRSRPAISPIGSLHRVSRFEIQPAHLPVCYRARTAHTKFVRCRPVCPDSSPPITARLQPAFGKTSIIPTVPRIRRMDAPCASPLLCII